MKFFTGGKRMRWPNVWNQTEANREWVPRVDAEAEIEKARAKGAAEGLRAQYKYAMDEARSDEREQIIGILGSTKGMYHKLEDRLTDRIRSRGTPSKESCDCPCHLGPFSKHGGDIPDHRPGSPCRCEEPKPLEHITNGCQTWLDAPAISTINSLVNKVSRLDDAMRRHSAAVVDLQNRMSIR
jgi:hypothetical protein